MTSTRRMLDVPYSRGASGHCYTILVTDVMWPILQDLLVQSGEIRGCEVTFTQVEDHGQS